jgi:hypothetical protein
MPKYGGRRYGYGRPGRRVRGYYRARSRQPGPIPGCLLPLVLAAAITVHLTRRQTTRTSTLTTGAAKGCELSGA